MRILDLGCGCGRELATWGVTESDEVTGVDINLDSLAEARLRFPARKFVPGSGESIPFPLASFDRVVSLGALRCMNITKTLAEIHRVLVPGGNFTATLHSASFTLRELWRNAFPRPIPTLYRIYVLGNGLWFHSTGRTLRFVNHRTETAHTERGMSIALERAGFEGITFRREQRPAGEVFIVEARAEKRFRFITGPVPGLSGKAPAA